MHSNAQYICAVKPKFYQNLGWWFILELDGNWPFIENKCLSVQGSLFIIEPVVPKVWEGPCSLGGLELLRGRGGQHSKARRQKWAVLEDYNSIKLRNMMHFNNPIVGGLSLYYLFGFAK